MKSYHYFVSYTGATQEWVTYTASGEVVRDAPITTYEQVQDCSRLILSGDDRLATAVILNFQLLRVEETP